MDTLPPAVAWLESTPGILSSGPGPAYQYPMAQVLEPLWPHNHTRCPCYDLEQGARWRPGDNPHPPEYPGRQP